MKIKDARSLPSFAQEDLRSRAVKAVLGGKKQVEVAEMFGVTRQAVGNWVKAYRAGGARGIKAKKRGRPTGGSILPGQAALIVRTIMNRPPGQLKLPFYLWTREAVSRLIEDRFGISLSTWTVARYLARWGFTPQNPVRRAFEKDPELVRRWLEVEYPSIRRRAKQEVAEIFWGDETCMGSDHAVGRTYVHRGQTPFIAVTGQRFVFSMISAITNLGRLNFMVFRDRFSAGVFLNFIKRLVRQAPKKVFLIVDRHPVHLSFKVNTWIIKHPNKIELFYLPGYSPELNPDEMLNHDIKSNAVGLKFSADLIELLSQVRSYLRSRQRQPYLVKRYFLEENFRYAAI